MSILFLPREALFPSHFTSVRYEDMEAGEPNIPKVTGFGKSKTWSQKRIDGKGEVCYDIGIYFDL